MDQLNYSAWSAQQAQKQMDFQERMSNTSHQREVADLQAAGLNPVLSSGGNGASTPSGAMATGNPDDFSSAVEAIKAFAYGFGKGSADGKDDTDSSPYSLPAYREGEEEYIKKLRESGDPVRIVQAERLEKQAVKNNGSFLSRILYSAAQLSPNSGAAKSLYKLAEKVEGRDSALIAPWKAVNAFQEKVAGSAKAALSKHVSWNPPK